jgi:rhodanese-related sulfurtransferase
MRTKVQWFKLVCWLNWVYIFIFLPLAGCAQDESFDAMFHRLTRGAVPVVQPSECAGKTGLIYLDAREPNEFAVSHIPSARLVGYDDFKIDSVRDLPKDAPIVVYCSVGYRSEKIGEELKKAGFTNVSNLYGGIFQWVNSGNPVYDAKGKTDRVHTYSKRWSKWLERGVKVYE